MTDSYANTGLAQFALQRCKDFDAMKHSTGLIDKLTANLNAMRKVDDLRKKPFKKDETLDWRSDAYLPEIKTKVYSVFATLCDIVFKGDEIQFQLKPSPYEDELIEGDAQVKLQKEEDRDLMEEKVKEQHRLFKQLMENKKALLSSCIYAMSWMKYNVKPCKKEMYKQEQFTPEGFGAVQASWQYEETLVKVPGYRYASVWNISWDMEEEDIQKGGGICERTPISTWEARSKIGQPLYLKEAIEKVIRAASSKSSSNIDADNLTPGLRDIADRKKGIICREFWGRAPRKQVESFEERIAKTKKYPGKRGYETLLPEDFDMTFGVPENSGDEVEVMVELMDEEIVRFCRRPPEDRPYTYSVPEMTLDGDIPTGLSDNMAEDQYLMNGIMRAILDNLRLAANVLLAIKRRFLADPMDSDKPLKPGEKFEISDNCDDARKAISQILIQDVSSGAAQVFGLVRQMSDDHTLNPRIMQGGVNPKQKSDTAYELSQLLENASRYLGLLAKSNDQDHIEPQTMKNVKYNMDDPDFGGPEQRGKGNYICNATGFMSLQNKIVRTEAILKMLTIFMQMPLAAAELKIRPHMDEVYRQSNLDPDDFLKSEDEKATEAQAVKELQAEQAQQQQDMAAQAEAMKAQGDLAKEETKAQSDLAREQARAQAQKETEGVKIQGKAAADSAKAEEDFQRNIVMKALDQDAEDRRKEVTGRQPQ